MNFGNENRPLAVDVRDIALDLRAGNAKLFQYIGKIGVRNVAKDGKNFLKLSLTLNISRSLLAKYAAVIALRKLKKLRSTIFC